LKTIFKQSHWNKNFAKATPKRWHCQDRHQRFVQCIEGKPLRSREQWPSRKRGFQNLLSSFHDRDYCNRVSLKIVLYIGWVSLIKILGARSMTHFGFGDICTYIIFWGWDPGLSVMLIYISCTVYIHILRVISYNIFCVPASWLQLTMWSRYGIFHLLASCWP
jgi:hypothetical protein